MSNSGKMPTECDICSEPFTKQLRKAIQCKKCNLVSCLQCNKRYLLEKKDLHCMGCRVGWTDAQATENLGGFIHKGYRQYTKGLLWDMQKARMPETMPAVERELKIRSMREEQIKLDIQVREALHSFNNLKDMQRILKHNIEHGLVDGSSKSDMEKKKREFIRACPVNDCPGFLSSQWKCGVCETWTCKDCMEVIGKDKQAEHVCNPDVLASAQLLKKETKPCPSCSAAIFKISGCDQMWCTQCQVAFSWRTGLKVTGVIHNPHFYEWQKKGGENIQNPGAIACGGLPGIGAFAASLEKMNFHQFYESADLENGTKSNFVRIFNNTRQRSHFTNYIAQTKFVKYFRYKNSLRAICGDRIHLGNGPIGKTYKIPDNFKIPLNDNSHYNIPSQHLHIMKERIRDSDNYSYYLDLTISETIFNIYEFCCSLNNLHRAINHFQHVELDEYRRKINAQQNDNYQKKRVKYLMKELSEDNFKRSLMIDDRRAKKNRAVLDIFEVYNQVTGDCIREIYHQTNNNKHNTKDSISDHIFNVIKEQFVRIENVRKYSNVELLKISKVYKQVAPFIRRDGYLETFSYENWKKIDKFEKEHLKMNSETDIFNFAYELHKETPDTIILQKAMSSYNNLDVFHQLRNRIPRIFMRTPRKISDKENEIFQHYLLSSRHTRYRRRF